MDEKFTATDLLIKSPEVLKHLTDDLSKQIYDLRLEYLIDRNENFLRKKSALLCQSIDEDSKLNFISKVNGDFNTIVIFGTGKVGHYVLKLLSDSKYKEKNILFCDNNSSKWNTNLTVGGGYIK